MVRKERCSESNSSMLCAGLLALRAREKAWRECPLNEGNSLVSQSDLTNGERVNCLWHYFLKRYIDMWNQTMYAVAIQQLGLRSILGLQR